MQLHELQALFKGALLTSSGKRMEVCLVGYAEAWRAKDKWRGRQGLHHLRALAGDRDVEVRPALGSRSSSPSHYELLKIPVFRDVA